MWWIVHCVIPIIHIILKISMWVDFCARQIRVVALRIEVLELHRVNLWLGSFVLYYYLLACINYFWKMKLYCVLCIVYCALCIVYVLCIVYCVLCIVYCALYYISCYIDVLLLFIALYYFFLKNEVVLCIVRYQFVLSIMYSM